MPGRFASFGFAAVFALFCAACSDRGPAVDAVSEDGGPAAGAQFSPDDAAQDAAEAPQEKQQKAAPRIQRDSLAGRWFLVLSRQSDYYAILLDFIEQGDGYEAKLEEVAEILGGEATLADAQISQDEVRLTFDLGGQPLDFRGKFQDGEIRGNVVVGLGSIRCEPARLVATNDDSLDDYSKPQPVPEHQELVEAVQSQDLNQVRAFTRKHASSPLSVLLFNLLVMQAGDEEFSAADLEQLAADYLKTAAQWGPRMATWARIDTALALVEHNRSLELASKSLAEAQAALKPDDPSPWANQIKMAQTRIQLAGDDPEQHHQAAEFLRERRNDEPLNKEITSHLAQLAKKQGQVDQAIELYAELAALPPTQREVMEMQQAARSGGPRTPQPIAQLSELWQEKHGGTEGLNEYLNKIYSERIYSFAERGREPAAERGNRTLLFELLTGAQCPPCIAADVAAGGIETTYPRSEVIVLRYHQHVPAPDPTANPHSEARMSYYGAEGTPAVYVNGLPVPEVGGFLDRSVGTYQRLRSTIEPLLSEQTEIRINASAQANDGELTISAELDGAAPSKDWRLRLVLAEDEIDYLAGNGIRKHEMVVRWAAGGLDGISSQDGKLSHRETLNLGEFKQGLLDSLAEFEANVQRFQRGFRFDAKPMELKRLHLVAFVQDDKTKEILQATAIPVSGTLEYPDAKTGEAPETNEQPDADEAGDTGDEANESQTGEAKANDVEAEQAVP